jgi:hypothetical protein
MIPTIGVMIGLYIIIRMFSFILRTGDYKESLFVRILCGLNIPITLFFMIDLVLGGKK